MNRKDLPLLVLLIGLMLGWPYIDRYVFVPIFGTSKPAPEAPQPPPAAPGGEAPAIEPDGTKPPAMEPAPEPAPVQEPPAPESLVVLSNATVQLTLTSHGAAIQSARMLEFPQTRAGESGPVAFDFADQPALAFTGLPGSAPSSAFTVRPGPDAQTALFERTTAAGLQITRTVSLAPAGYVITVKDEFRNTSSQAIVLKEHGLRLGAMADLPGETHMSGYAPLGIDVLPAGQPVTIWGKNLPGFFKERGPRPPATLDVPLRDKRLTEDVAFDWVAVKNKYFVQACLPSADKIRSAVVHAERVVVPEESRPDYAVKKPALARVAATVQFEGRELAPNAAPFVRETRVYLGPKLYSELNALGARMTDVMELGSWKIMKAIASSLLYGLNAIHRVVGNYGVAIILLTLLIRVIFWPITHKGTQSMKKLAELQPKLKEIQEKYKDNPKRLQQELGQFYRDNKVNPFGGCLPMLIQIPVFIALFWVLRSAIELRFAPFLWIRDLSEPENLMVGLLPFGLALNPLPLLMTATQIVQQKLTPSGGDPAQQKMMLWMPVIFLVFFYSFPSGLALYWTTSNLLMIVQLVWQKSHHHTGPAGPAPVRG